MDPHSYEYGASVHHADCQYAVELAWHFKGLLAISIAWKESGPSPTGRWDIFGPIAMATHCHGTNLILSQPSSTEIEEIKQGSEDGGSRYRLDMTFRE